jgi:hypothetical protein
MAGDYVCFSAGEASRKYLRLVWELDKILSQKSEASGHMWSLMLFAGCSEK